MQLRILSGRSANFSPRTSKRQTLLYSTCVAMQMPLNADVEVLFKVHVLPTNCFLPIFRDACCEDWQSFGFAARDLGLDAGTWKPHGVAQAEKVTQPDAWLGSEGGWFTPMVLPYMFSRWLALQNRFDLAKTSSCKTPRTMHNIFLPTSLT